MKYLDFQEDWTTVLVIEWALSFKSLVKRTWIGTISISIVYVLTYDQPLCIISIGSVPWFSDENYVFEVSSFMFDLPLNLSEVLSIYKWAFTFLILYVFSSFFSVKLKLFCFHTDFVAIHLETQHKSSKNTLLHIVCKVSWF